MGGDNEASVHGFSWEVVPIICLDRQLVRYKLNVFIQNRNDYQKHCKVQFFWEALLTRDFPVESDKQRHGYHNSCVTSLRCLLAKVFMKRYCPSSSLLRRKSFFFILPWFMERVLCHGSWQKSRCLPGAQDPGPQLPFSFPRWAVYSRQRWSSPAQPTSSQNR